MTNSEAKEIINQYEIVGTKDEWQIEDAQFGDGSHTVNFGQVFDSKTEAQEFVEALKTLYKK